MPEALDRIDPNVVGVPESSRRSRRRNVQEQNHPVNRDSERDFAHGTEKRFRGSDVGFHDSDHQRHKIDQFLKLLVEQPIMSDTETDYVVNNARLRLQYLQETEFAEVSGPSSKNSESTGYPLDTLLKWEAEKQLFAVWVDQAKYFPAFQFQNQNPMPIVGKILNILPNDMTGWHIAYWFSSENGWLKWDFPQHCLNQEERILNAAKQESLELHRF